MSTPGDAIAHPAKVTPDDELVAARSDEKRDNGNEIKIQPYSGDGYELKVAGPFMSDTVYNMNGPPKMMVCHVANNPVRRPLP